MKIVLFDPEPFLSIEDSGAAKILDVSPDDDSHIWVKIISWDTSCSHDKINKLLCSKIKVTIETVE